MHAVLVEIESVLSVLIKYENQSELLEIVRQIIDLEQSIHERTKKEHQRELFEGLLDK